MDREYRPLFFFGRPPLLGLTEREASQPIHPAVVGSHDLHASWQCIHSIAYVCVEYMIDENSIDLYQRFQEDGG